jgi:hypothetical protein
MRLPDFIKSLISDGKVLVETTPKNFSAAELEQTAEILSRFYHEDCIHMPGKAPLFQKDAALWAAVFTYGIIQYTLIRNLEMDDFPVYYPQFTGTMDAAAIYSADLCLRHMPQMYHFAKSLAPGDDLLKMIEETAAVWPFSSVGIPLAQDPDISTILDHPSLKIAYIDRIFEKKDAPRLQPQNIQTAAREVLGQAWDTLSPPLLKEIIIQ